MTSVEFGIKKKLSDGGACIPYFEMDQSCDPVTSQHGTLDTDYKLPEKTSFIRMQIEHKSEPINRYDLRGKIRLWNITV